MEWGPWIEHDGSGCPVLGRVVHIVLGDLGGLKPTSEKWDVPVIAEINGRECIYIAQPEGWAWGDGYYPIVRYRVRKPLGLKILEEIALTVKESEDA